MTFGQTENKASLVSNIPSIVDKSYPRRPPGSGLFNKQAAQRGREVNIVVQNVCKGGSSHVFAPKTSEIANIEVMD